MHVSVVEHAIQRRADRPTFGSVRDELKVKSTSNRKGQNKSVLSSTFELAKEVSPSARPTDVLRILFNYVWDAPPLRLI